MVIKRRKHQWEQTEKNMEHGEHFNESIVNEVILEDMKKNRIDHMKYLPGMEVLEESDVMYQVISAMNAYDYDKYTRQMYAGHLLMITVHQRIFRHCCLRLRCLFWRKSRRLRRRNQETFWEQCVYVYPYLYCKLL